MSTGIVQNQVKIRLQRLSHRRPTEAVVRQTMRQYERWFMPAGAIIVDGDAIRLYRRLLPIGHLPHLPRDWAHYKLSTARGKPQLGRWRRFAYSP